MMLTPEVAHLPQRRNRKKEKKEKIMNDGVFHLVTVLFQSLDPDEEDGNLIIF